MHGCGPPGYLAGETHLSQIKSLNTSLICSKGRLTCAWASTAANCEACWAEKEPKGFVPWPKAAAAAAADGW